MSTTEEKTEASKASGAGEFSFAFEITASELANGERRGTSFRLNSRIHRWLKAFAALNDAQEGDVVNEAVAFYLEKNDFIRVQR